ncbi:metal-dependent phosphohydrolase [Vibrio galatheae]|uniref:Metal-dependent phosphohydrolase n=1 Tax=Vibrio galatheae TaxID=579748 RepID=A0A0F4NL64_9VIBR|nr:HD domain-containing phosphohydrolase [Vibrio galatheae]KJY83887.1 metal-dependent phosphohydrolase [Vibrio galatheae]
MNKRRYSLSIHITSLFLTITTFVGIVLIAISYLHSQQLLKQSAKELSNENSLKLETTFQRRIGPVLTTLDFLSMTEVIEGGKAPYDRPRFINAVTSVFERSPELVSLFFANLEGDFTSLRPLRTDADKQRFDAPEQTSMLIIKTTVSGENIFYYLDKTHQIIDSVARNDNEFDPRKRPWYTNAARDGEIRLTEPYLFYYHKTHGVTLSRKSPTGNHVVGADFTLDSLTEQINTLGESTRTKMMLFDTQFNPLTHLHEVTNEGQTEQQAIENSIFQPILGRDTNQIYYQSVQYQGENWSVTLTPVVLNKQTQLLLAEATPQNDILSSLLSMRERQVHVAILMIGISFILVWFISRRLANPLQTLVKQTENIARFDFQKTRYPKSVIREVSDLTKSIELMEHTLHDLLRLLRETASNKDFSLLAKTVAHQSYLVTRAETIVFYTREKDDDLFAISANHAIIPFKIDLNEFLDSTAWIKTDLVNGSIVHLNRSDNALAKHREYLYNSDLYFFPIHNRDGKLVGILLLGYERAIQKAQSDKHAFLKELLSFAEIAKENIAQMEQQKEMLNAFVELIASAIDTKSPYTGSHCQRVPTLTKMIVKAAVEDDLHFPQFSMSKQQWEELHLAAWLHDCGKVTTPEFVIDKATKLETIYDRIHEVRMRFELLKAQAEIDFWKGLNAGEDKQQLKATLTQRHKKLDDDFAFVGQCNIGSESMSEEALNRLVEISQYKWTRTLDDQIGVSWVEKQRASEAQNLPVEEYLLADKTVHKIHWDSCVKPQELWQEEFILSPSDLKYNRGELYNLSIERGTLNSEERYMINDHIIQTIMMLKRLPYPDHLKNVPEIAGGHHERIDGRGYPKGLHEEQLSIPARVMAIADVFEALTSSDRPYKKAKTLAESIDIMTNMATTGHIDPKLYLIFLEQSIDQEYASQFLDESQKTGFDRQTHIKKVKDFIKSRF